MPILVDSEPGNLQQLQAGMPAGSHAVSGLDRMFAWLDQHSDEYVVALGPSLPLDHVLAVAEELRFKRPTVSLVLVRDRLDTDVLTRAMHDAQLGDTVRFRQRVHLAGVVDRDRGAVDEQRTRPRGGQNLGVATFHQLAVGQHGDDHVGPGHRVGSAVETGDSARGRGGHRRGHWIKSAHRVVGGNQIRRHGPTHIAQAQESHRQMLSHLGPF